MNLLAMWNLHIASSICIFLAVIFLVTCEDGCEVNRVENGKVLKADLIPITNSSGYQIRTQAIYLQADTSSSVDSGSSMYIRCKDAYRFQGDRTRVLAEITCTNGKWVPFPVCLLPPCDKRSLKHAGLDQTGERTFFHGESFEPKCLQGYKVAEKADKKIYCENGRWTGNLPPCTKEVQCKLPDKPDFGSVELIGNSASVGSVVIFRCDPGRKLVGSVVSRCNNASEWTSPTPRCVASCQTETLLDFEGLLVENRRTLDDGDWFSVRCDEGFEVASKDDPKIYCRDGRWEGNLPPCSPAKKASCKTEALLDFMGLLVENRPTLDDGEWFQARCDEGFRLANPDNTKIVCRDGTWWGSFPPCGRAAKAPCETVSLPDFEGFLAENKSTFSDGEWFLPSCDEGFQIADKTDPKIYCRDGKWEGNIPPCSLTEEEVQCEVPEKPDFGSVKLLHDKITVGSIAIFSCNAGRKLRGAEVSVCVTVGVWMPPTPTCVASCDIESLVNFEGFIVETTRTLEEGEMLLPRCDEGFEIADKIDPKIYCRGGRWDGNIPPCSRVEKKASCDIQSLIDFEGFIVETTGTLQDGEMLLPRCDEGFEIADKIDPKIYCRGGRWDGNIPPCSRVEKKASCDIQSLIDFEGFIVETTGTLEDGEMLLPRCDEGFEIADKIDPKIYCRGGRWDGNIPPCSRVEKTDDCKIPSVSGGELGKYEKSRALRGRKTWFKKISDGSTLNENDSVILRCQNSNIRRGKMYTEITIFCLNGKLSPEPKCVIKGTPCETESLLGFAGLVLSGSSTVDDGEWIEPLCTEGYEFLDRNASKLYCRNGRWEGTLPPCYPAPCLDRPPVPENGRIKPTWWKIEHGAAVEYECLRNSEMTDVGTVVCSFGKWTGSLPTCRDKRCYRRNLLNKEGVDLFSDESVQSFMKANILCVEGYTLKYPDVRCVHGEWQTENNLSPCQESECEILSIANAEILKEISTPVRSFEGSVIGTSTVYEQADIGSIKSSGESLYVSCRDPYKFQGGEDEELNKITCRRGNWLPSPQCILQSTCSMESLYDLVSEDVVAYTDEDTDSEVPSGIVLKLGCSRFQMVFKGNSNAVCNADGTWSVESNIQCSHGCTDLDVDPDSELIISPVKRFYSFGDSITFSCPEGMSLTEDVERILCLRYGWEPNIIPDCQ